MALSRVVSEIFNVENETRVRGHSKHWKWCHSINWVWFPVSVL